MRRCWTLLLLPVLACTGAPERPPVEVTGIEPAQGAEGAAVPVRVAGSGFHVAVEHDLGTGVWRAEVLASLGNVELESVQLVDDAEIAAVVPASAPAGTHGLVVRFSDGRLGWLAAAYTVVPRVVVFTAVPAAVQVGACSSAFTFELQDGFGHPAPPSEPVRAYLDAGSGALRLYGDSACGTPIPLIDLAAGQAAGNFHARGLAAGSATLRVTVAGYVSALHTADVAP